MWKVDPPESWDCRHAETVRLEGPGFLPRRLTVIQHGLTSFTLSAGDFGFTHCLEAKLWRDARAEALQILLERPNLSEGERRRARGLLAEAQAGTSQPLVEVELPGTDTSVRLAMLKKEGTMRWHLFYSPLLPDVMMLESKTLEEAKLESFGLVEDRLATLFAGMVALRLSTQQESFGLTEGRLESFGLTEGRLATLFAGMVALRLSTHQEK